MDLPFLSKLAILIDNPSHHRRILSMKYEYPTITPSGKGNCILFGYKKTFFLLSLFNILPFTFMDL